MSDNEGHRGVINAGRMIDRDASTSLGEESPMLDRLRATVRLHGGSAIQVADSMAAAARMRTANTAPSPPEDDVEEELNAQALTNFLTALGEERVYAWSAYLKDEAQEETPI